MSKLWNVKEWSVIISSMRSLGSILFQSQDMLSFRTHVFGEMIVPNGEKTKKESDENIRGLQSTLRAILLILFIRNASCTRKNAISA